MAGANTKNLGQVAGLSISSTPPANQALIWYDTTPSVMQHKVYDQVLGQWIVINNSILSTITYTELQNLATGAGLPLGKFFVITDKGNVTALSISPTKVQYTDSQGNIVIDDLGSVQQYHVPSTNLRIDGLSGIFDDTTKSLNFLFEELAPDTESYLFGKQLTSSGLFTLFKFKISKLLSAVTGNALTWQNGLYFNFTQALLDTSGKPGGVVTFEEFTQDQGRQDQQIQNLSQSVSAIPDTINMSISQATSDAAIAAKKIVSLSPTGGQSPLAVGDTFTVAWNKIQGWFNSLRYATGSTLTGLSTITGIPAQGDTVQVAIGKLYRMILAGGVGGGTIDAGALANGSVTEPKHATGGVSTRALADQCVTESKYASNSVPTRALQNASVTDQKLASNSVTADKMQDGAVTWRKMALKPFAVYIDVSFNGTSWNLSAATKDALFSGQSFPTLTLTGLASPNVFLADIGVDASGASYWITAATITQIGPDDGMYIIYSIFPSSQSGSGAKITLAGKAWAGGSPSPTRVLITGFWSGN